MLNALNQLPVKNIKKQNLTLHYKIEHGLLPEYLSNYLVKKEKLYGYNIRAR